MCKSEWCSWTIVPICAMQMPDIVSFILSAVQYKNNDKQLPDQLSHSICLRTTLFTQQVARHVRLTLILSKNIGLMYSYHLMCQH